MSSDTELLRKKIDAELDILTDPVFKRGEEYGVLAGSIGEFAFDSLKSLREEKKEFFDRYEYHWACEPDFYNDPFEAHLQWRLLNVLSDIPVDHPSLENAKGIVVRYIPSASARVHVRKVDEFNVIVLPSGYLSVLKGFARLFIKGRALGRLHREDSVKADYNSQREEFLLGAEYQEEALYQAAGAYIGVFLQLMENELPLMDGESIFDEGLITHKDFGIQFGQMSHAIDGFILFHELHHILNKDLSSDKSPLEIELMADKGSVSLCIIDEARKGGVGTLHVGAPIFFSVELLRLLTEEIVQVIRKQHDASSGRYPGIEELMLRSNVYEKHLLSYMPIMIPMYRQWRHAIHPTYNTARWALLKTVLGEEYMADSLYEFLASQHSKEAAKK